MNEQIISDGDIFQAPKHSLKYRREKHILRIAIAIVLGLLLLSLFVYTILSSFRVTKITVTGSGFENEYEVKEKCGIEKGDRLLLIDREEIRDTVFASFPDCKRLEITVNSDGEVCLALSK